MLKDSLFVNGVSENYTSNIPVIVITCLNGIGGIMFSSYSSDILIRSLTINNCTNDTNFKSAALFLDEMFNIILNLLTISNSAGYGLVMKNGEASGHQ